MPDRHLRLVVSNPAPEPEPDLTDWAAVDADYYGAGSTVGRPVDRGDP